MPLLDVVLATDGWSKSSLPSLNLTRRLIPQNRKDLPGDESRVGIGSKKDVIGGNLLGLRRSSELGFLAERRHFIRR